MHVFFTAPRPSCGGSFPSTWTSATSSTLTVRGRLIQHCFLIMLCKVLISIYIAYKVLYVLWNIGSAAAASTTSATLRRTASWTSSPGRAGTDAKVRGWHSQGGAIRAKKCRNFSTLAHLLRYQILYFSFVAFKIFDAFVFISVTCQSLLVAIQRDLPSINSWMMIFQWVSLPGKISLWQLKLPILFSSTACPLFHAKFREECHECNEKADSKNYHCDSELSKNERFLVPYLKKWDRYRWVHHIVLQLV